MPESIRSAWAAIGVLQSPSSAIRTPRSAATQVAEVGSFIPHGMDAATDVVVAQRQRLAWRDLQHLLRPRRERNLPRTRFLARADEPHHLRTNPFDGDPVRLKCARGQTLLLAKQAQQDVLGADVVVLEAPGLLLGQHNDLTSSSGESLKHALKTPSPSDLLQARPSRAAS